MRVFGSSRVIVDGNEVDLGRRQVKQLVAGLALHSGRSVTVDALIEMLWSGELPANPRRALNVALSRLRASLGPMADRLVHETDAYRLDADRLDVDRFEEAIVAAREAADAEAAALLSDALDSWVGEPFGDCADSEASSARRSALSELRWFAATRLCELWNAAGRHEDAAELSASFLDADVVRERLVAVHAAALAACGRRSEALRVLAAAASTLRASGLSPSPALADLEHAILVGAVDLDPVALTSVGGEASAFVGRGAELTRLEQIRPGETIAVVGEGGIGKSTLLARFEESRRASGARVVRVEVSPHPTRPLDAIAALCEAVAEWAPPDERAASAVARVCPGLGVPTGGRLGRDELIDGLTGFLQAASDTVMILDDAHWLDAGSADIVERLATDGITTIVLGLRPSDSPRLRALVDHVAETSTIRLGGLALDDISEVLSSASLGRIPPGAAERLLEQTAGNALFVRLLVADVAEAGVLQSELSSSILVAVRNRLDPLSRSTLETLDVAALLGQEFDMQPLRQLRANADAELFAAADAGLVSLDRGADTGRFVHALIADACRQLLASGRRVALHDEIGRSLESGGASAIEVSMHYREAADLDPDRAIWSTLDAAGEVIGVFDWESARELISSAQDLADRYDVGDDALTAEITVRRGVVESALGSPGYVELLIDGCERAREADNAELFAVAAAELCGFGATTGTGAADGGVVALVEEALALDLPPIMRAELCVRAAPLFSATRDAAVGRRLYREGWDLSFVLGHDELERSVLENAHLGFAHPDDFDLLGLAGERMAMLADGDADLIWESAFIGFQRACVLGDPDRATAALDTMRDMVDAVRRRPRDFGMAFSESAWGSLTGDIAHAESAAERALAIGLERFDASWATTVFGLLLLSARQQQGRSAELHDVVQDLVAGSPDYVPYRAVSSMLATEQGDADAARRELDALMRRGFDGVERDLHFTSILTLLAPAVATVGTAGERSELQALLLPYTGRMSWNGASSNGPIDGALAQLAAVDGDAAAAAAFQRAADELVSRFRR